MSPIRAVTPVQIGSVCSGYGGLDMGIRAVLPTAELAWVADHEPPTKKNPKPRQGAARILAHRFPGVPNLGDITATRWADTAPVKIVCGGTPCQDMSHAGAGAGMRAGTRSGLWSSMAAAIAHHRPTLVVWENVRGALSAAADSNVEPCPICVGDGRDAHLRALGRVHGDLADLGYDARWIGLRAADVGAPHGRFRVFVAAWPEDPTRDPRGQHDGEPAVAANTRSEAVRLGPGLRPVQPDGLGWGRPDHDTAPDAADAPGNGLDEGRAESAGQLRRSDAAERRSGATADPDVQGLEGRYPAGRADQGRATSDGERRGAAGRDRGAAADTDSDALREQSEPEPGRGRPAIARLAGTDAAAHADCSGREPVQSGLLEGKPDPARSHGTDWGEFRRAVRRWEHALGRPAPAPTEPGPKAGQRLSPRFVEWMMGLPDGWVTDVPGLDRNDQLHALGNGVVPQQAAAAVRYLLEQAPDRVRIPLGLHPRQLRQVTG